MIYNFTINEINLILQALGNAPYVQVFDLIEKIQKETKTQLNEKNKNEILSTKET